MSMPDNTSSLEDTQGILYRGRALSGQIGDIPDMADTMWRERLQKAITDSKRSMRSISLDASTGPGYLHSILVEGKDPSIAKFTAICEELRVSAAWVLYGYNVRPEDEEFLRIIQENPEKRDHLLALIGRAKAS